jgi:hypothetical protein
VQVRVNPIERFSLVLCYVNKDGGFEYNKNKR